MERNRCLLKSYTITSHDSWHLGDALSIQLFHSLEFAVYFLAFRNLLFCGWERTKSTSKTSPCDRQQRFCCYCFHTTFIVNIFQRSQQNAAKSSNKHCCKNHIVPICPTIISKPANIWLSSPRHDCGQQNYSYYRRKFMSHAFCLVLLFFGS